jgi:hypothetical protein
MAAASAYLQLASGLIGGPSQVAQQRTPLLVYGERGTLAVAELPRALIRLAG